MIVISYDISDDKIRARFTRLLTKMGAVRLQYSVYEVICTNRTIDNLMLKIKAFSKRFSPDDSVVMFNVDSDKLLKYGNAIHRDKSIVFFD